MSTTRTRLRKTISLAAAPLAVLAAGALVWQGSQAAFTATTANNGNTWSSGKVTLTDDDLGMAAFHVDDIVPGQTDSKCVAVTSASSVAGEVRNYISHLTTDGRGLEDRIMLKIETGTGGSFNDCTGFSPDPTKTATVQSLTAAAGTAYDYATGRAAWDTAGTPGESRTYRATWSFDTTGLTQAQIDSLQGAKVSADFTWELQNTTPAA